jgi:hypothetical protein
MVTPGRLNFYADLVLGKRATPEHALVVAGLDEAELTEEFKAAETLIDEGLRETCLERRASLYCGTWFKCEGLYEAAGLKEGENAPGLQSRLREALFERYRSHWIVTYQVDRFGDEVLVFRPRLPN